MISDLVTSKGGISGILAGIAWFLTVVTPVLPLVWGNLISAILGVYALYAHTQVVTAARTAGVRGVNGKLV